jgi:hypothetical protein
MFNSLVSVFRNSSEGEWAKDEEDGAVNVLCSTMNLNPLISSEKTDSVPAINRQPRKIDFTRTTTSSSWFYYTTKAGPEQAKHQFSRSAGVLFLPQAPGGYFTWTNLAIGIFTPGLINSNK